MTIASHQSKKSVDKKSSHVVVEYHQKKTWQASQNTQQSNQANVITENDYVVGITSAWHDSTWNWNEFTELKKCGSPDPIFSTYRNKIFFSYRPLADGLANCIVRGLPYRPLVEPDDLHSAAYFGLLQAIDSFEVGKGNQFNTFATYRIRGAILDELRNLQNFSRANSRIRREIEPLMKILWHRLCRKPTADDLTEFYPKKLIGDMYLEDIIRDPLLFASVFNQQEVSTGKDGSQKNIENDIELCMARMRTSLPEKPEDQQQRVDLIEKILKLLCVDQKEKMVIFCYYCMGMTSGQICETAKLSPTWVSEKMKSGLRRLRKAAYKDEVFAEEIRGI